MAIDCNSGNVLAVGNEAKRMVGRTPANVVAVRPMKDGVIADFDVTEKMLRYFMNRATRRNGLFKPRVVVGIPSGVTEVEKRAIIDASIQAGAKFVFDRGADGSRDRSRPSGKRAYRKHDRGHRRRND